jgi:hypothetical protein
MNWYTISINGNEVNLSSVLCSPMGVGDCMKCYHLPAAEDTLRMAIDLWLNGRTSALVFSRHWTGRNWSLASEDLTCS